MALPDSIEEDLVSAERDGTLIAFVARNELRREGAELGAKLSEMHNSGQISLTSEKNRNAIQELGHNDFWVAVHPLREALADLVSSEHEMLAYVSTLVERGGSDLAAGMPNTAFTDWCKSNPQEASKVIERVRRCDPLALKHGVFAVLGLANQQIPFDLIAHREAEVRTLGMRSLGRMDGWDLGGLKSGVNEAYRALSNETDEELRIAAIETAFRLWEQAPSDTRYKQIEIINLVGQRGDPTELTVLAAMLVYHHKGLAGGDIDLILEWLSKRPSNASATLNHLNMAIRRNDKRWKFGKVVEAIEFCLPMLDEPPDADDFYGFCEWLWSEDKHVSFVFSRWLSRANRDQCNFLNEILQGRSSGRLVDFKRNDLPQNPKDQLFLAEKCIGYLWNHEVVAASILLSIVRNGASQSRAYAEELLFHPLLLSYGGRLRDFLEGQRNDKSKRVAQCVERLLAKHDAHIAGTEETRDVIELRPTIEQRRAVAMKDRDRNREIQKAAHRRSIFADLVSHQTLLYGRKSLSIIHGTDGKQHPQITALTEHSYSFELPRLSVIDPVGFNQLLTVFRAKKREQR